MGSAETVNTNTSSTAGILNWNMNFGPILGLVGAAFCVYQDIRTRKISNQTNLIILCCGIVTVTLSNSLNEISLIGSLQSVLFSFLLAALISIPVYLVKALGGGDIKLFLALSVYLSINEVITLFVAALVWGTLMGIIKAILDKKHKLFFKNIQSLALKIKPNEEQLTKIPFSVALLLGFLTVLVLQKTNGVFL